MRAARLWPLALAAGCAGAPPPRPQVNDGPRAETVSIVSPARWDYHPSGPSTALAATKLDAGGCVLTAEGGQRWTAAATKMAGNRLVCAGKAEASAAVASEDLSSAIRRADGSWIFVGASGALFEAPDPLAPFTRTVPAPEPLARVAGAGAGVLATTLDGRMLRWEEASGWRPAVTSGPLAGKRVYDVVVGENGRALALSLPEMLFESADGGATWSPTGAPPIGTRLLGRTNDGALGALGLFETLVWKPSAGRAFTRGTEKVQAQQAVLDVEVGRAPSAAAVQAGRAVIDFDRYYELVRPENDGDPWLLARGRIDGRLETSALAFAKSCGNLRLGARGKTVYVVCVAQDKSEIAAEVRRSTDAGASFGEPLRLVTPDTDQINLAVSTDGSALITGLCRASDANGGCKPAAPVRIAADAAPAADAGANASGLRATVASAPQLTGSALLPAISLDGRSAYFLGRRGKDDRINLFVSHDGGDSFSPRTLDGGNGPRAKRQRDDEDEPNESTDNTPDTFEVDDTSTLRVGEDGTLGMLLLRTRGDWAYVLADDDGRVLQASSAPADASDEEGHGQPVIMAGAGRRVLAIPMVTPDNGALYWESLDGGATWDRQPAPQSLAREYERGQPAITCALGGCLLGETVTRLGWGGQSSEVAGGDRTPDAPPASTQSVRTPIVCELAKTPWARIENAYGGLSYAAAPIPGTHEIMRGRAVWSVLTIDRRTGAIGATSAMLPESGEGEARVITRQMMGPKPSGQHLATAISASQHEGFAAVRVAVPADAKTGKIKPGAPMRNVEVAWENFLEGTSGRARIADAGPFEANDVALGENAARRRMREDGNVLPDALHASLISVTSRGIFVHPHARSQGAPAFFIDPTGRIERYQPHTWPSSSPVGGSIDLHVDASAVGGQLLGVGMVRDTDGEWSWLALAHRPSASAPVDVNALALLPPRSVAPLMAFTSWSWAPKAPVGVVAIAADPLHQKAWAHFVGFRNDGTFFPAEPAPTLLDLGDRPRGCSASDRAASARVNVPFMLDTRPMFPGERHPVIVREPKPKNAVTVDDAFVLLTAGAILQGTPASPCVAAFEAPAVGGQRSTVGAVLPGDLAHAWMFRFSWDAPRAAGKRPEAADPVPSLEYRPMSCHYDPAARVPESVWNEPGTSRP